MANGILEKIRKNQEAEQERVNIEKCKSVYDATMAGIFAENKGSATETSKYLKKVQPTEIKYFVTSVGKEYGEKGTSYVRNRLQADINKNELQLAADRDRLRREGYDVGRNRGNNLII